MIIERANTEYSSYRIPVLVMMPSGALIACYECRKEPSDWSEIHLKIIKSVDKGETWQTLRVIKSDGDTLNNPVFIVKENVLHFLYCKNYRRLFYERSLDEGETFSAPKDVSEIFEKAKLPFTVVAVGPSHGITHGGNLLAPVWLAYNLENLHAHQPSYITTIYSTDDGENWEVGECIGKDFFVNASECSMALTKENGITISIRNENKCENNGYCRGFAESETGRSDWKNIRLQENMPDCVCQGAAFFDGEKSYHVNCLGTEFRRTQLTMKISTDGFQSYQSVLIDEIGGYADFVVKDATAYVLYERNPVHDGLYFKKISL